MSSNNLQVVSTSGPTGQATTNVSPSVFMYPDTTLQTFSGTQSMIMSTGITKISAALVKAQRNTTTALKDAKNPYFKSSYADLNSVIDAVQPALNDQGIAILQPIVQANGKNYVRTLLMHESGEYLGSDNEIVTKPNGTAQDLGSGISYARRYGLQSLLSVKTAEDDDGNRASAKTVTKPVPQETAVQSTGVQEVNGAVPPTAPPTEATKPPSSFNKRAKEAPAPKASPESNGWD